MSGKRRRIAVLAGVLLLALAATVGRKAAFHVLPLRWTGEGTRLAAALRLAPGMTVADIGAGDGDMALEIARILGDTSIVYATEMTEAQRTEIAGNARGAGFTNVRVLAAAERGTALPDRCCEAIYLRTVLHHIDDRAAYAGDLRRTLKPGGRLAIIDFEPGGFLHLAGNHGITRDQTVGLLTRAGFRLEQSVENWGGGLFAIVFRND